MKQRLNELLSGYGTHCESVKKVENGHKIKIANTRAFFAADCELEFSDSWWTENLRAMMGYSFDKDILGRHSEELSKVYGRLTAGK